MKPRSDLKLMALRVIHNMGRDSNQDKGTISMTASGTMK